MYVWNGFTIVGKRADFTESLLVTVESAEEKLRNDPRKIITQLLPVPMMTLYKPPCQRSEESIGSISHSSAVLNTLDEL